MCWRACRPCWSRLRRSGTLALQAAAQPDLLLSADQSLMTQLLLNLTENAIKYGREGGWVRINARREGDCVCLTVADNGVGISAEQLPHIFERFFRAVTARNRTGGGLGLAIAQWIVGLAAHVCAPKAGRKGARALP